jgi:hypothetical protein
MQVDEMLGVVKLADGTIKATACYEHRVTGWDGECPTCVTVRCVTRLR